MLQLSLHTVLCSLLLCGGLLLSIAPADAQIIQASQNAPHGYDFLTVTVTEGFSPAKILIVPAFQGKTEIKLEPNGGGISNTKNVEASQRNASVVNQQLSDLTIAGWELAAVYSCNISGYTVPRYLFRKPRP